MPMIDLKQPASFDVATFPQRVVAEAADMLPGTLRQWIFRGHLDFVETAEGTAHRPSIARKLFTFRHVLTVAAASALSRSRVDVAEAIKAARVWTESGYDGLPPSYLSKYPARTLLVYHTGFDAMILTYNSYRESDEVIEKMLSRGSPVTICPIVVSLDSVASYAGHVCSRRLEQ